MFSSIAMPEFLSDSSSTRSTGESSEELGVYTIKQMMPVMIKSVPITARVRLILKYCVGMAETCVH
jgi:hypothetical protein